MWEFVEQIEYQKQYPSTARRYGECTRKWIDGEYFYRTALDINMKAASGTKS